MSVISWNAFHVFQAVFNIAERRCGITSSESIEEGSAQELPLLSSVCNGMYSNIYIVLLAPQNNPYLVIDKA